MINFSECMFPWFQLNIDYEKTVKPCCFMSRRQQFENINELRDISSIWNQDYLKSIRKAIGYGGSYNPCEGCTFAENYNTDATEMNFSNMPDYLTEKQITNWQKAMKNFNEKKIVLDSLPVCYTIVFGVSCNIRCKMCFQNEIRTLHKEEIPVEMLLDMKECWTTAMEIQIIGGEPLYIKESIKFLQAIADDPDYDSVLVTVVTNGLLLDEFFEMFKKFKHLKIRVSLDGVKDVYNEIRRGSNWNRVEKNILMYIDYAKKNNLDWIIATQNTFMKSTLIGLKEFTDWCVKYDVMATFGQMFHGTGDSDEDIFANPYLLKDIQSWEDNMDYAIEQFGKKGWPSSGLLRNWKVALKKHVDFLSKFNNDFIEKGLHVYSEDFVNCISKQNNNSNIVLFASGNKASHLLKNFENIKQYLNSDAKITAIYDNDKNKWGTKLLGVDICKPDIDELKKADKIAITVAFANDIINQLLDMGINKEQIIMCYNDLLL